MINQRNATKTVLGAFLALSVVTTSPAFAKASVEFRGSPTAKQMAWMDKGVEQVKRKLKDPDSARFTDLFVNDTVAVVTCGWVTAKNSFGGYGSKQRFVSGGRPDLTFLESEVDDFGAVWRQLCL